MIYFNFWRLVGFSLFLVFAVADAQTATQDFYEFEGNPVLYSGTNASSNPDLPNQGYQLTLAGSFSNPQDFDGPGFDVPGMGTVGYNPGFGYYEPSAPGANSGVTIESTNDISDPPSNVEAGGFYGLTNYSFNVSGVGGQIESLAVIGSGMIGLGNLTVTGYSPNAATEGPETTLSSIGGTELFDGNTSEGFAPSVQTYNGGSLTTPFLSMQVTTALGTGTDGSAPDPIADAGSMVFNGTTLMTNRTVVEGAGFTSPAPYPYVNGAVTLNNSTLNVTTELDVVGTEETNSNVTGTTSIVASNSTITAGTLLIATGNPYSINSNGVGSYIPSYGTGSPNSPAEIDLISSNLDVTQGGDAPPSLVVGDTGDGTLKATDSTIDSVQTVIGNTAHSTGMVTLNNTSWTNTSFLTVGSSGTATLNVTNGSGVESNDVLFIGLNGGSTGTVNLTDGGQITTQTTGIDGTNSTVLGQNAKSSGFLNIDGEDSGLLSEGDMGIGYNGNGTVMITGGGALEVDGDILRVGRNAGSIGMLTVTGSGSLVDEENGTIYIGYGGTGTVSIEDGADLKVDATDIGGLTGALGELDVQGASTTAELGTVTIGDAGDATLNVTAGASVTTEDITIGTQDADTEPLLYVGGSGTQVTADGDLVVGDQGVGDAQVSDQATLTVNMLTVGNGETGDGLLTLDSGGTLTTSDDATIADEAGSHGDVEVKDTGTVLKINGDLKVGGGGDGSLTVSDNATVSNQDATVGDEDGSTGTAEVTGQGSIWHSFGSLTIGDSGTGEVTIDDGGTLRVDGDLTIGKSEGSDGTLTIDGTGSHFNYSGGDVTIGGSGTGGMTVQNGAAVDLSGTSVTVGDAEENSDDTGDGTLTVTGGDSMLNTADLTIGGKGDGTLEVLDGGTLSSGDGTIADEEDSTGSATVSGAGSNWSASDLTVGGQGTGTLNIEDGGTVTISSTELAIGDESSGNGTVTISGESSALKFQGELQVGEEGTGVFAVQDGASFVGHAVNVGDKPGSTGTLNVDGIGTTMEVQTDFNIGEQGDGTLNVTNGADLMGDGDAALADMAGSTATATVDSSSSWTTGDTLTVGGQGIATLTVSGGSTDVAHDFTLGDFAVGAGEIDVMGSSSDTSSTLHFGDNLIVGNKGIGTLDITDGGQASPTATGSGEIDVAAMAQSTGTVTVSGTDSQSGKASEIDATNLAIGGTLKAAGGTANFIVNDGGMVKVASKIQLWSGGTVDVKTEGSVTIGSGTKAGAGTVQIDKGGTLGGGGSIIGDVVNAGGTVAPGDPQSLTINGNYSQTGGLLELQLAGTASGDYDQIIATNNITITDGTIDLDFVEGFAPKEGDVFDLLAAGSGGATGSVDLSDVTFDVSGLEPGFDYKTSIDPSTNKLQLTSLNNGMASAPEPSTWAFVLAGMGMLGWLGRKRHKSSPIGLSSVVEQ